VSVVLDACALIAYLNGEEGADQVENLYKSLDEVDVLWIR
jgi:PIN domain nuclease of toxin-antitoxin system